MSNADVGGRTTPSQEKLFKLLADESRREVLRLVADRSPTGITPGDLAYEIAAVTNDKPLAEVTDDEHQRARIDCQHRLLPALKDADVLDDENGMLVATDALPDATLDTIRAGDDHPSNADLETVFSALADERRRTVLAALANQSDTVSVDALARVVAQREPSADDTTAAVDSIRTSLVHVHLPLLADADLIKYETESGQVIAADTAAQCVSWFESDDEGMTGECAALQSEVPL
ncbi:DUF7344 domain-containing protein [Natronolimnobius baerhuensis]|uniref:DUF7344 domain-containing protein n=1 Tax=Natronolimnobius baerhuensis TaxID=253108 RepID=A0A202EDK1_9EURY|nr:hypothetical protein [Natronolimnobius baerhuensis]OVE86322.1 hypothetical protein B2G88_05955 [Natronolimnobius baerhuensis]